MERYVTEQKSVFRSKKWLTAVIAAIIPIANAVFGLNLDTAEVITVILPLIIYVFAQGAVDAKH